MNERELFNLLISLDPLPGKKGRIFRNELGDYILPEWILKACNKENKRIQKLNLRYKDVRFNKQLLIDILLLGFRSIDDRPKCKFCLKPCIFTPPKKIDSNYNYESFSKLTVDDFYLTCGEKDCVKKQISYKVKNLWGDSNYRELQTNSHKLWSSKEENIERLRKSTLSLWKNEDYRSKQVNSHKLWASKEENREKLRESVSRLWKNEDYRSKQINSHIEWARKILMV